MRGFYPACMAVTHHAWLSRHVWLLRITCGFNAVHAAFTWLAWLLRVTCGCYTARAAFTRHARLLPARAALTRHAGLKRNMRDLVLLSSVLSSNAVFYFWIFCSNFKCIVLFFNDTIHFLMTCFVLFFNVLFHFQIFCFFSHVLFFEGFSYFWKLFISFFAFFSLYYVNTLKNIQNQS